MSSESVSSGQDRVRKGARTSIPANDSAHVKSGLLRVLAAAVPAFLMISVGFSVCVTATSMSGWSGWMPPTDSSSVSEPVGATYIDPTGHIQVSLASTLEGVNKPVDGGSYFTSYVPTTLYVDTLGTLGYSSGGAEIYDPNLHWVSGSSEINVGDNTGCNVNFVVAGHQYYFRYYGKWYSSVWVSPNGYIQFGTEIADGTVTPSTPQSGYPQSSAPNGVVAPFWCDLDPTKSGSGKVKLGLAGGPYNSYYDDYSLVIVWDGVMEKISGTKEYFAVWLGLDSDNIYFYYKDVTYVTTATSGFENQQGLLGTMGPQAVQNRYLYTYLASLDNKWTIEKVTISATKESDPSASVYIRPSRNGISNYFPQINCKPYSETHNIYGDNPWYPWLGLTADYLLGAAIGGATSGWKPGLGEFYSSGSYLKSVYDLGKHYHEGWYEYAPRDLEQWAEDTAPAKLVMSCQDGVNTAKMPSSIYVAPVVEWRLLGSGYPEHTLAIRAIIEARDGLGVAHVLTDVCVQGFTYKGKFQTLQFNEAFEQNSLYQFTLTKSGTGVVESSSSKFFSPQYSMHITYGIGGKGIGYATSSAISANFDKYYEIRLWYYSTGSKIMRVIQNGHVYLEERLGILYARDSSSEFTVRALDVNSWNNIRICVSPESGTYVVRISGIYTTIGLRSSSSGNTFSVGSPTTSSTQYMGESYWDNINVFAYPQASFMDTFANGVTSWTLTQGAGTVSKDSSTGKLAPSMRLSRTTTGDLMAYRTFTPQSQSPADYLAKHVVFEVDVMVSASMNKWCYINLYQGSSMKTYFALESGYFAWWNGASYVKVGAYGADTWYRVAIDVNLKASTYTIWIDGREFVAGPAWGGAVTSLDRAQVQCGSGNQGGVNMWIDNAAVWSYFDNPANVLQTSPNAPPAADISATQSYLTVSVSANGRDADGYVIQYAWNWGDGYTATGATASHTYAVGGTYPIQLTVMDNLGETGTITKSVTVVPANMPPTASFTKTITGVLVNVDASASTDPDGTISTYAWNWGDGSLTGPSSSKTASHNYLASGTYTIQLTVTDNKGAVGTASTSVTLTNLPPTASFTKTLNGWNVNVDASGSSDVDGSISTYAWSWGDGTTTPASSSKTASHHYTAAGTYPIRLTVTDTAGGTATTSQSVTTTADTTGPTTTITLYGEHYRTQYLPPVGVEVKSTDTQSGVASIWYRLGTSGSFTRYTGMLSFSGLGSYTVQAYSIDLLGNVGKTVSTSFSIVSGIPV